MKLLNQSLKFISFYMLIIISIWALIFFFSIYKEIKSSADEGLDNYKRQIVAQAFYDTSILENNNFDDGFFTINQIEDKRAIRYKDRYSDTIMRMQDSDDLVPELEPARMLSTVFEMDDKYYELKVIHSMIEEDDLVKQLFWNTTWLYTALFITIIIINNFVLKRLWQPFYVYLNKLKHYKIGSSKTKPSINSKTTEFNDLHHAVDTLLEHNLTVFEQQKQFISNASHELQTPLAIVINKLELLIESGELDSNNAKVVGETVEIVERLTRINKSLLLLSRIENNQFMDNQSVSINQITKSNIEDLREVSDFKRIKISLSEENDLETIIDPSLANIIISNLIRNAIFHNHPDGLIEVSIQNNIFRICNTGKKEQLNEENLFSRFYKSDSSSSGLGLGLAIVKAICNMYGYTISYNYESNMHCFEIIFNQ